MMREKSDLTVFTAPILIITNPSSASCFVILELQLECYNDGIEVAKFYTTSMEKLQQEAREIMRLGPLSLLLRMTTNQVYGLTECKEKPAYVEEGR